MRVSFILLGWIYLRVSGITNPTRKCRIVSDERQISQVLAKYVRATDARDGAAQGALFTDDAVIQIFSKTGPGEWSPVGEPLVGGAAVEFAVNNYMAPHPEGGSSHHMTADHIIDVVGDRAHLSSQFVVFKTQGAQRPGDGWPAGTAGVQGTVQPIESGYYETDLQKIDGVWMITAHQVRLDLPMVLPGS
jgi:SnoaL-like domain